MIFWSSFMTPNNYMFQIISCSLQLLWQLFLKSCYISKKFSANFQKAFTELFRLKNPFLTYKLTKNSCPCDGRNRMNVHQLQIQLKSLPNSFQISVLLTFYRKKTFLLELKIQLLNQDKLFFLTDYKITISKLIIYIKYVFSLLYKFIIGYYS